MTQLRGIYSCPDMNPENAASPAQRLVVDRGSVGWNQALWLYPRPEDGSLAAMPPNCLQSAPPVGEAVDHVVGGCGF